MEKNQIIYIQVYMVNERAEFLEIIEANRFKIIRKIIGTTDKDMSAIVPQVIRLIPQSNVSNMLAENNFEAFKSIVERGNVDAFIALIEHAPESLNEVMHRVGPAYFMEAITKAKDSDHTGKDMSAIAPQFIRLIPQSNVSNMLTESNFEAFKSIVERGNVDAFIALIEHAPESLNEVMHRVGPAYFMEAITKAKDSDHTGTRKIIFSCYQVFARDVENSHTYKTNMESLIGLTWADIHRRYPRNQQNTNPKVAFNLDPCEMKVCFYTLRYVMHYNAEDDGVLACINFYLRIPVVRNLILGGHNNELLDLAIRMPGKNKDHVALFLRQVGLDVFEKLKTCGELGGLMLKESEDLFRIASGRFPIAEKAAQKLVAILKALHSFSALNEQQLCEALKAKESQLNVALNLAVNGNDSFEPDSKIIQEIHDACTAIENRGEAMSQNVTSMNLSA